MTDASEWLPLPEAAALVRIDYYRLRAAMIRGDHGLKGQKVGGRWLVSKESLDNYVAALNADSQSGSG